MGDSKIDNISKDSPNRRVWIPDEDGVEVFVKCPDYCPEGYTVATYEDGKYLAQGSDEDITKYVVSWTHIYDIEEAAEECILNFRPTEPWMDTGVELNTNDN